MRRIGIDVGGTNTDAVLVEGDGVEAGVKTATTEDVTTGVVRAIEDLVQTLGGEVGPVDAVMIGTTHFTNAVVERRELSKIAAIRIGLPAVRSLPPFVDWPEDVAAIVRGEIFQIEGGHEYDGSPIVPFDEKAVRDAARRITDGGLTSVAVASVFSPLIGDCEERAAEILKEENAQLDVTLSKEVGRIGLLGRENATLLNASIIDLARRTSRSFVEALRESGIAAPLYLTQNDGTVMRAEFAESFPVFSFASGPTNSMRGAAFLSNLEEAIVADVGGTTTDIGCLKAGFPREANSDVEIGGIRTLFRMPDLLSIGLGGGSLVDRSTAQAGPRSVGYRLTEKALVFGGTELTATDIAVASGLVDLGDRSRLGHLDPALTERCRKTMWERIAVAVDRMKTDAAPLPLIAVGGGAFLVPEKVPGISEVVHVTHQEVANAVGAAIAQVSGEVDQVFSGLSRTDALEAAERLARKRAADAGARPETLSVVEVEDLPLAYLPGESRRVRLRVVGDAGFDAAFE